jgi:hypothetical protein
VQHPVAAVVVVPDAHGHAIVFGGSGDLLRYPPNTPADSAAGSAIVTVLIVGLFALVFVFGRRSVRQLANRFPPGSTGSRAGSRTDPKLTDLAQPDTSSRDAQNGHDASRQISGQREPG